MKTEGRQHKLLDSIFTFFLILSFAIFLVLGTLIVTLRYKEYIVKVENTYKLRLNEQKSLMEQKIDDIENLALFQKEQSTAPQLSQENLLHFISGIRFGKNGNGYIYVIKKSTGHVIMHPVSPDTVGRDVRNIHDAHGINIGREMYQAIASTGVAFFRYSWLQPSTGKIVPKIGYARYVPEFDWILASGVYINDINDEIQGYRQQLKRTIFWNTLIILGAMLGGLGVFGFFLYIVKQRFMRDLNHVSEYFKKAAVKGERIDTKVLTYQEFQDLGGYLNIVIKENHRIYQRLTSLAEHDSLTNLFNRRKFMEHLEREFQLSKRYSHSISLLMMDLDHFKRVNDTYGHDAGDLVLKLFAELCVKSIRDVDIAGRIGGEEFAVLMPATGKENAVIVAERIRNEIAHRDFEYGGKPFNVTISIGVASIPPERLNSFAELLKIADTFLYKAKETGRNKVCL